MINQAHIPFYDGYWYCYANSTAMLLGSIGECISPRLIEPLTGVGLGAMFLQGPGLLFFSGAAGAPDVGISKALEILGFQYTERHQENGPAPFSELAETLKNGPAVLGPLDMSFLDFNPNRPRAAGVDHYILAYKMDGDRVYVNDPAGFTQVFISKNRLSQAWRADSIGYKRGRYRYWANPQRVKTPDQTAIYQCAMDWFRTLYTRANENAQKTLINGAAIQYLADLFHQDEIRNFQIGFLKGFALPLGAKRAFDYAVFFRNYYPELSDIKQYQSSLFGEAQSLLMSDDRAGLVNILRRLADVEDQVKDLVMA